MCDPSTCSGCCSTDGTQCIGAASQSTSQCGAGGTICQSCTGAGQRCDTNAGSPSLGRCVCDGAAASCPNGCCSAAVNGTCTGYASQSTSVCGAAGAACHVCGPCASSCSTGDCQPATDGAQVAACGVYLCDGSSTFCPSSCTGDADCIAVTFCEAASCIGRLADGNACSRARQCTSGQCVTYFRDADGDGYGNSAVAASVCGSAPPSGYVANASDCCDSDANARPGQAEWFSSANGCGNYEYDCVGGGVRRWESTTDCTASPRTACTGSGAKWFEAVPSCGATGREAHCSWTGTAQVGECSPGVVVYATQMCH